VLNTTLLRVCFYSNSSSKSNFNSFALSHRLVHCLLHLFMGQKLFEKSYQISVNPNIQHSRICMYIYICWQHAILATCCFWQQCCCQHDVCGCCLVSFHLKCFCCCCLLLVADTDLIEWAPGSDGRGRGQAPLLRTSRCSNNMKIIKTVS